MGEFTDHRLPITSADAGLIRGYEIPHTGELHDVSQDALDHVLDRAARNAHSITWLHFNLSNALARQSILRHGIVPPDASAAFCEHQERRRAELSDSGGLLIVASDLTFEPDSEPADVATLWCYVTERLLITGRIHPLKTVDDLRSALRGGLRARSAIELLIWIIDRRTDSLRNIAVDIGEQVNDLEDEILAGSIRAQREQLGRIRRLCARIRRHFAPDRVSFRRLLQRPLPLLNDEQTDSLRSVTDDLAFLIEEVDETYERAKLLQEELSSRLAENTGRSLYVLAILTAVFLPMTLISGIFGMNVAGLPGLHNSQAFWLVTVLICAAGAVTLAAIFWRSGR